MRRTSEAGPPVPGSFKDTGLTKESIADLLIKTLYVQGARTGERLAGSVKLPHVLLDDLLLEMQQRQLVQVLGTEGPARATYVFELTGEGRTRAREAMEASQYVGAAPVPLDLYAEWVQRQTIAQVHVTREEIAGGFGELVFPDSMLRQIGPAINSAKSMFLYGHSGNGKTAMADKISQMIGGTVFVPYAVETEGRVIVLHDPVYHRPVGDEEEDRGNGKPAWLREPAEHDPRFARVARPVVFAGGELTLDELDLQYDPYSKYYQAPFQMKANNGVLIIDDLGRQLVSPRDLLNRWIVPLEKRIDYLTLHTGHKFPVPFDTLLIFATNLNPHDLVDEAFMRRIHYKVNVGNPSYELYEEIFRDCCARQGVEFRPGAVRHIFDRYYGEHGVPPRSCHPRDIVEHLRDVAKFEDTPAVLSDDLLDEACRSYFLDMPEDMAVDPY